MCYIKLIIYLYYYLYKHLIKITNKIIIKLFTAKWHVQIEVLSGRNIC